MTIRSTLTERLRLLDFTNPVKVFLRDLIEGVPTTEESVSTTNSYITAEDVAASGYVASGTNVTLGVVTAENLILSNTSWDDLRFPATGINPPGAASDPTRNTTTGLLDFSASATNVIVVTGQLPHKWKTGSPVGPHLHIRYPDAVTGNSVWQIQYEIAGINQQFPSSFTSEIKTFAAPGVARKHALHAFSDIDMSSITGVSAAINCIISRLGGVSGDTYGSVMPLLEFDIHYQVDGFGSEEKYIKSY